MSKNDFLYALKEDLPEDFSNKLRGELRQIDSELSTTTQLKKPNTRSWWVLAVASIATGIIGILLIISRNPSTDFLNIAQLPPTLTNHGEITSQTIHDLQPILRLGHGFAQEIILSPDAQTLLVNTSAGFYLHDAQNLNAEPQPLEASPQTQIIGYVNDNDLLAYIPYEDNKTAEVVQLSTETNEMKYLFEIEANDVMHTEISANGRYLFIQHRPILQPLYEGFWVRINYTVQVYEISTGILLSEFEAATAPENFAASYNDTHLVYMQQTDAGVQAYLMDLVTGDANLILEMPYTAHFTNQFASPEYLSLSSDGNTLVIHHTGIYPRGGHMTLWNIEDLLNSETTPSTLTHEPQEMQNYVVDVPINSANDSNNTNNDETDEQQTPQMFFLDLPINTQEMQHPLVFSQNSDSLYALMNSGQIMHLSRSNGTLLDITHRYDGGSAHQYFFTNDNQLLTTSNQPSGTLAHWWDLNSNNPSSSLFMPDGETPNIISPNLALSHDGSYIVYLEDSGTTWFHDLQTGERSQTYVNLHNVRDLAINPQNMLRIIDNHLVYDYDLQDYTVGDRLSSDVHLLNDEYISYNSELFRYGTSLSHDGQMMLTAACSSKTAYSSTNTPTSIFPCADEIALWDLEMNQVLAVLQDDNWSNAMHAEFSSDGRHIAVINCNIAENQALTCDEVFFYDISELLLANEDNISQLNVEPTSSIEFHSNTVPSIVFQPYRINDESELVIISDNVTGNAMILQLNRDGTTETIQTRPLGSNVAFSPDGNLIFATADTGQIEVWAIPNMRIISTNNGS